MLASNQAVWYESSLQKMGDLISPYQCFSVDSVNMFGYLKWKIMSSF